MWQPAGGKVCEMGRLGARRGGTHLLCVCPSFPESPNREDRGAPPAFMISGAHRAPGPASCLLCWREAVRHDRRLLGPLPSGQVSSLLMETPGAS